mmetsp:Transcript_17208/g.60074  ORF Transcript_17208/g.60074 Transcript_17208/m.60074 type:complete len:330 (+) Transcript_17208:85-1074(+)
MYAPLAKRQCAVSVAGAERALGNHTLLAVAVPVAVVAAHASGSVLATLGLRGVLARLGAIEGMAHGTHAGHTARRGLRWGRRRGRGRHHEAGGRCHTWRPLEGRRRRRRRDRCRHRRHLMRTHRLHGHAEVEMAFLLWSGGLTRRHHAHAEEGVIVLLGRGLRLLVGRCIDSSTSSRNLAHGLTQLLVLALCELRARRAAHGRGRARGRAGHVDPRHLRSALPTKAGELQGRVVPCRSERSNLSFVLRQLQRQLQRHRFQHQGLCMRLLIPQHGRPATGEAGAAVTGRRRIRCAPSPAHELGRATLGLEEDKRGHGKFADACSALRVRL